jgi:hypothetical protein
VVERPCRLVAGGDLDEQRARPRADQPVREPAHQPPGDAAAAKRRNRADRDDLGLVGGAPGEREARRPLGLGGGKAEQRDGAGQRHDPGDVGGRPVLVEAFAVKRRQDLGMLGAGFDDVDLAARARRQLGARGAEIDRLGRVVARGEAGCGFGDAGGVGQVADAGAHGLARTAKFEELVRAGAQHQAAGRHEVGRRLVAHRARGDDPGAVCRPGGQIELAAPGIDQGGDGAAVRVVADVEPDRLEAGEAADRRAERQLQPARQRQPDADAGEGAGADGDGDAVDVGKLCAAAVQHAAHHAHERLGMAALDRLPGMRQDAACIEDGRRTGAERGVEGEDAHGERRYYVPAPVSLPGLSAIQG